MRAVTNSSVLISLASIGQLSLLSYRFPDGIFVASAVWKEVVKTGLGQPGADEVASASWIDRYDVRDRDFVSLLCAELDEGEAETIALARQENIPVVLLDEKDARQVARRLNLQVLGTVGLLIWGKRAGHISSLRHSLDILRTQGGFRLSQSLYEEALKAVGESTSPE